MNKTANTIGAILLTAPLLVGCVSSETSTGSPKTAEAPAQMATTYPASEADSFDEVSAEIARHPDVQVPESSSIREACEIYFAADAIDTTVGNRYDDKIYSEALRVSDGEITEEEFAETTRPWQRSVWRAERRYKASQVGVLRAAGYSDWKMYSRYSLEGVGDLWRSNALAGDKVPNDENHPDYRYTFASLWTMEVVNICKSYKP